MKQGVLDNRAQILGYGDQFATLMNAHSALTTSNFTWPIHDNVDMGSVHIFVSASFVGTTATLALQGSNDNTNFGTVFQNDGTTPVSFTLAASDNKFVDMQRVLYKYYRLVYTAGNASAGTITANFIGKK